MTAVPSPALHSLPTPYHLWNWESCYVSKLLQYFKPNTKITGSKRAQIPNTWLVKMHIFSPLLANGAWLFPLFKYSFLLILLETKTQPKPTRVQLNRGCGSHTVHYGRGETAHWNAELKSSIFLRASHRLSCKNQQGWRKISQTTWTMVMHWVRPCSVAMTFAFRGKKNPNNFLLCTAAIFKP